MLQTMIGNTAKTARPAHGRGMYRPIPICKARRGPLVSILLPTYNRRRYLPEALASALRQTYSNLEVFLVNDGGEDVGDVVRSFRDPRVIFIDRKENRGKPFSLNQALDRAQGKYVAYLDDDDVYYPHHVETLVNALENETDCHVAYSDLYRSYCDIRPDGQRIVLGKYLEISRDFDRYMMLYFNHVLHVSLMHRRDLLGRTGCYNENLNILIDWDMTRRLAFFTDFHHVPVITGEYYCPVGESDRISVQKRRNKIEYLKNVLTIRVTRPPKPWPRIEDLAIVLLVDHLDQHVAQTMHGIWQRTFYPYKLYIPLMPADIARIDTEMPNTELVPVNAHSSIEERVDVVLGLCDASYVALVPSDLPIKDMWIENPIGALINSAADEGFLLKGGQPDRLAAVVRRIDLERSRKAHPHASIAESLTAAGIRVREACATEWPFQFDMLLNDARAAEADGDWITAARTFEYLAAYCGNKLWMKAEAARAYYEAGYRAKAAVLSWEVNRERTTVDTLLLEARAHRQEGSLDTAIRLLTQAEELLGDNWRPRVVPGACLRSTSSIISEG